MVVFVWVLDDRAVPGLYWMRGGGEDEGALQTLMDVVSENERDMQFFSILLHIAAAETDQLIFQSSRCNSFIICSPKFDRFSFGVATQCADLFRSPLSSHLSLSPYEHVYLFLRLSGLCRSDFWQPLLFSAVQLHIMK